MKAEQIKVGDIFLVTDADGKTCGTAEVTRITEVSIFSKHSNLKRKEFPEHRDSKTTIQRYLDQGTYRPCMLFKQEMFLDGWAITLECPGLRGPILLARKMLTDEANELMTALTEGARQCYAFSPAKNKIDQ